MGEYPRPFDVVVEFTLSPQRKSAFTAKEIRAPLFAAPGEQTGFDILLDLDGLVPIKPGETRQAPGLFSNPEEARRRLPAGATFTSFEIDGAIVRWRTEVAAAE